MKITKIKLYKGSTYCLSLENGERLYLGENIIADYSLDTLTDYDEDFFDEIKEKHILTKAKKHALYCLGRKSYCYGEMNAKLEKLYGEDIAVEVCDYLEELGYINDENYANDFAEYAILRKKWGVFKARFEMQKRGIDKDLIENVLAEYGSEDYEEQITEVLQTRFANKLETEKEVQRAFGYFMRRGYNYSDVRRCIKAEIDRLNSEIELDDEI